MEDGIACHILDPRQRVISTAYPIHFGFGEKIYPCNYKDGKENHSSQKFLS